MFFDKTPTGVLARQTLIKMAVRVAIVILGATAVSYFHVFSILESQTRAQLAKYVIERGQRERSLFALAEDNLAELKKELLVQLKQREEQDLREEFNKLFVKHKDGVTRNRPESFDYTRQAGVWIDPKLTIDADVRRRVLIFYNLANAYGPAWKNRFASTYFLTPENFSVSYWPTSAIAQGQPADTYEPGEEYFWAADKEHNPQRKTVWTGVYYDHLVKQWMVSCVSPVYVGDRHMATVGHDVLLNELIKRTVNDQLKGTYNIIFRKDGRLIAHPELMKKIEESEGKFDILKSGDQHLKNIFQLVKDIKPGEVVIDNAKHGEYLAVTFIPGPNWYFVVVFPKSILSQQALATVRFILILGLISLLVEVIVLFSVLRKSFATPMQQFQIDASTTRQYGGMTANAMQGDWEACIHAGMDDYLSKPIQVEELVQALSECQPNRAGEAGGDKRAGGEEWQGEQRENVQTDSLSEQISSTSPAPEAPPLDAKALQALRDMAGEAAEEVLAAVIDSYLEDAPQLLQAIAQAVAQGDAIALRHAAHTLKSTSATLGATTLSKLCKQLEVIGHAGTTADAPALVSQVETEYARVQAALQFNPPNTQHPSS